MIPNIKINGNKSINEADIPLRYMTAIEQLTKVIVLPDKYGIVASKGIVKSEIFDFTPVFFACCNVTGMVAAED